jgi:hypothetical protein
LADFFENKSKFLQNIPLKFFGVQFLWNFARKKNTGVNWGLPELKLNPKWVHPLAMDIGTPNSIGNHVFLFQFCET